MPNNPEQKCAFRRHYGKYAIADLVVTWLWAMMASRAVVAYGHAVAAYKTPPIHIGWTLFLAALTNAVVVAWILLLRRFRACVPQTNARADAFTAAVVLSVVVLKAGMNPLLSRWLHGPYEFAYLGHVVYSITAALLYSVAEVSLLVLVRLATNWMPDSASSGNNKP